MKIDRLYGEMLCLLRCGTVSASALAGKFEVSIRTVQRDMDTLAQAGVPVSSLLGPNGGYRIERTFEIRQHPATDRDYSHIRTALQALASATDDPEIQTTLAKLLDKPTETADSSGDGMILDFSVLREGNVLPQLRLLQAAIAEKCAVSFFYTNARDETYSVTAEPAAVLYRWYSWYLLGLPQTEPEQRAMPEDYRLYKLVRMRDVKRSLPFTRQHLPAETILQKKDAGERVEYTRLVLRCQPAVRMKVAEYLKGTVIETQQDGSLIMECMVVEQEHFWWGTLLGLSDQLEVLSPEHIRARLLETAEKILACYRKPDKQLS